MRLTETNCNRTERFFSVEKRTLSFFNGKHDIRTPSEVSRKIKWCRRGCGNISTKNALVREE